jgi:soluble lytic murein transglycosylase-like protein
MKRSPSYAPGSRSERPRARTLPRRRRPLALLQRLRPLLLLVWASVFGAAALPASADQQRDPELQAVVARAIAQAECFTDHYDSAVWYTLMEPRLRPLVKEKNERMDILQQVYCETHRPGESRLPPGLVMALIAVESRFDRWAVSSAGAVGLMQVMPFWPERLGMRRYELVHIAPNIHMGCAILRFYLGYEHNDVRKALARYNGSIGRRDYPDLVLSQWTRWRGADDLGFPPLATHR